MYNKIEILRDKNNHISGYVYDGKVLNARSLKNAIWEVFDIHGVRVTHTSEGEYILDSLELPKVRVKI